MVGTRALRLLEGALQISQGLLVLGIVAGGWSAVSHLSRASPSSVTVPTRAAPTESVPADSARPLSWYAPIWQRNLRQPPIPPAPKPKDEIKPEPPKPPPPRPTLLGTFVENEARWAHLADAAGKPRMLRVGETIGDYTLVGIEPGRVQLQNGADAPWVEVSKAATKEKKHR